MRFESDTLYQKDVVMQNKNEEIVLSDIQLNFLYGGLLGDGCLYLHKRGTNAQFIYTSKSYQHTEYVSKPFTEFLNNARIINYKYFDERTQKQYENYSFRTICNPAFTKVYNSWYSNGIKHIPNSLKLNPVICLIWYIGDGGICHSNRSEFIKLSTHCFDRDEQESILIPQLSDFGAKLMKSDFDINGNQQYFIYIPHRFENSFLNYIGDCPFNDYKYKWDVSPYKNFYLPNNKDKISQMIKLFENGKSSGTIAKLVGVDRSTVMKYLKLNGYDYKDNLYNRT
mgnify:CR=1 FL=1